MRYITDKKSLRLANKKSGFNYFRLARVRVCQRYASVILLWVPSVSLHPLSILSDIFLSVLLPFLPVVFALFLFLLFSPWSFVDRCPPDLFLSSRPRTGSAIILYYTMAYITGYGGTRSVNDIFSVQQTTYRVGNHVYYWVWLRPDQLIM